MRASSQNIAKTGLGDKPLFRRSPIGELVYRPSLNHKRSVSFISVRRWRQSSRKADLELFKRAKAEGNAAIVLSIAAEISELLDGLLHCKGQRGYWVTAPPRGASFYRGAHFASEIAREVAALLKLPYHRSGMETGPVQRARRHVLSHLFG